MLLKDGSSMPSGIVSGSDSSAVLSFDSVFSNSFRFDGCVSSLRVNEAMACCSLHLAHWKSSICSVERVPSMHSEMDVVLCTTIRSLLSSQVVR